MAPADEIRIVALRANDEHLAQVLSLHRAAKRYLGPMPDSAFIERLVAGRLWVALERDAVLAYALFDTPRQVVKLIHLTVDERARGRGLAKRLVDGIAAGHRTRAAITLRCRRDFPASGLWHRLGFLPVEEVAGRGTRRKPLTVWHRSLGQAELFADVEDERILVVLDHVVFEDLTISTPEGLSSGVLESDWVDEVAELAVTAETLREINDWSDPAGREALRTGAAHYRLLDPPTGIWEHFIELAKAAAPRCGEKDHRHLARAAACNAYALVTRDDEMLKRAPELEAALNLVVASPSDAFALLDRRRAGSTYAPAALEGTAFRVAESIRPEQQMVSALLNTAAGERTHELRHQIQLIRRGGNDGRVLEIQDGRGELVAALGTRREGTLLRCYLLRCKLSGRRGEAFARQLAARLRAAALESACEEVHVMESVLTAITRGALSNEDFTPGARGSYVCTVDATVERALSAHNLPEVAQRERDRWPLKVLGAGLPTFMIPIRIGWAGRLIDPRLADMELFDRPDALGLSREHVYFRSPHASGGLSSPARIVWYVSKDASHGGVRAISQLAEITELPARDAFRQYRPLGVWTWSEVSKHERVQALRFTHTEQVNPLSLERLRELYAQAGLRPFTAPQSPRRMSDEEFELIYRAGAHHLA